LSLFVSGIVGLQVFSERTKRTSYHVVFLPYAYSATTVLVLSLGSGVDGFTLDPDSGRFLHTHKDIRIPLKGPIYSFNEANYRDYEEAVQRYLSVLKEGASSTGLR
jgi:fructose-1,6-bisphosphatase I